MFKRLGELLSGQTESEENSTAGTMSSADLSFHWSSTALDNHRVDIFDPRLDTPVTGVVLFLHGHGRVMLNENLVFSQLFRQHGLAAVCPDGQRAWWLDRTCSEFSSEISPQRWLKDRLLPFIEARFGVQPPGVALLGVSMGGQGALQFSYRNARLFPVVAAISPAVDFFQLYGQGLPLDEMFTDVEEARQETVVLNLHPLDWPRRQWFCCDPQDHDWFDGCARLGMKLSSSGILHERDLETSAGGHTWDYFNHMAPMALQHIAAGLREL